MKKNYFHYVFSVLFIEQPPSIFCHPQANCFHRRLLVAAESPSLSPGSPPNNCKEGYTENKSEIKQAFSPLGKVLSEFTSETISSRTWDMKEGDACYSESIGSSECKVTNDHHQLPDSDEGKDSDDSMIAFSPNKRRGLNLDSGRAVFLLLRYPIHV